MYDLSYKISTQTLLRDKANRSYGQQDSKKHFLKTATKRKKDNRGRKIVKQRKVFPQMKGALGHSGPGQPDYVAARWG